MEEFILKYISPGAWGVIKALLLLVLAFIVAKIVKSLVVKLFTKTKLNALFGKKNSEEDRAKIIGFVAKLIHLIVFLLFVPGIFEALGMQGISSPILNVMNIVWSYLPNVIAAGIIIWAGFFIAGLVRDILVPVFNKIKLNRLQEKAGLEVSDRGKLSNTLAYIVYVLIIVPVIVAALSVLNISAISQPAILMLNTVFEYIPSILAALVIVVIGCMLAKLCGNIVERLMAATGLDAKLTKQLDGKAKGFVLSKAVGIIVDVVLVIFFVVEGVNVLQLKVVTEIGSAIIGFMPAALAAVLVLVICYVCASMADKALKKNDHEMAALIAKIAIYVLGAFMILNELGVATTIVNTAFIIVVAALGVAFAVSFGIGGKDFAGRMLAKLESKFGKKQ